MVEMTFNQSNENKTLRFGATIVVCLTLLLTIIFNGLAGSGTSPFTNSPGNVSDKYHTCIVPAGYTFIIWSLIYILLITLAIYAVSLLIRKVGATPAWQLGGFISTPFLAFFTLNMIFNITWLFMWDKENLIASSVLLFLCQIASNIAIACGSYTFMKAGPLLYETSKFDFWANVFMANAYNIYDMWLILAAILNLFITINAETDGENESTLCIIALCVILALSITYFIAEHTFLSKLGNPYVTHWWVYLWAAVGIYQGNKDYASDDVVNLIITNIFFAAFFLVARMIILPLRNKGNKYYINKEP